MTASMAKYLAFARAARTQALSERGEIYGRMAFFAIILGVFSSLWQAVADAGMPVAAEPKTLVWYLAATEWILLSTPPVHLEIQEALRRGDVVYELGRPVPYVLAEIAKGLGVLSIRLPILGATAVACAFAFTGRMPPAERILVFVPFGLVAAALMTVWHVWIGLLAFWLEDVAPVYWVWQKLAFVLGGLMLPLTMYPGLVQAVAAITPFPALLGAPASLVLETVSATPWQLTRDLAFWGVATAAGIGWTFRRASAALSVNGG
ncbi:MAG TPA: ABC-2 family transporter protein [Vicinamibacterales bacterium]|jgi:ABC-2 type transport system permease protein